MANYAGEFHGELVTDGDASDLTALTLYESGSDATGITLNERYLLVVTDVYIANETGGDIALVAGADAAGKRIVKGNVAATTVLDMHLKTPYVCAPGDTLKFQGAATAMNVCLVKGHIITR